MDPPAVIFGMLGLVVLAGALLAGYGLGMGKFPDWLHMLAFVLVLSLAICVILDFEFPRVGLVRIDRIDQVFMDLQESMKP